MSTEEIINLIMYDTCAEEPNVIDGGNYGNINDNDPKGKATQYLKTLDDPKQVSCTGTAPPSCEESNSVTPPPSWYSKEACHSFMQSLHDMSFAIPEFNRDRLGEDQRFAYETLLPRLLNRSSVAVRAIIHGAAGSGKSTLVHALRSELRSKCRVCAMTGLAAALVYGDTIYQLLHISPYSPINITAANQARLQTELQDVSCILLDDYSMFVVIFSLSLMKTLS